MRGSAGHVFLIKKGPCNGRPPLSESRQYLLDEKREWLALNLEHKVSGRGDTGRSRLQAPSRNLTAPAPHPSLKRCRRFPISAMASKMFTLQASSAGSRDLVGIAEGPAVGGPVGPAEGGPVEPAVGRSEGGAVGGPVAQTVGGAVGCGSAVAVAGGRGSGLGRGPKKRHRIRQPLFLRSAVPMDCLLPQSLPARPLALTLPTLDAGACLPPTLGRPFPFTYSPPSPGCWERNVF